jgi:predicted aspartyl protease
VITYRQQLNLALLILLALLCAVEAASLQARPPIPGTDDVTVRYTGKSEIADVPLETAEDVPFIAVRLAQRPSEQSWCVVDTGASYTLLDAELVKSLGLRPTGKGSIGGAGSGRVEVDLVPNINLEIGELRSSGHKAVVLDLKEIGRQLGRPVHGIIGYDLLSKAVVTLDYPKRRAKFQSPKSLTPEAAARMLPLRLERRWIYAPLRIRVPGGEEFEDHFFIDTGSGDEVNHPAIRKSTGPLRTTQTGVGIGQATQGVVGTLEYASIAGLRINQVSSSCCGGNPATHAQIGSGFLKHFAVTFDYANRRMFVSSVENTE